MRTKIRQQGHTGATVMMIISLALLGACKQVPTPAATLLPPLQPNATPGQVPEFLSRVDPEPGALVVQGVLSGNTIWATLQLEEIAEPGETLGLEEVQERVEFLIDGELLDAEIIQSYRTTQVQIAGDFSVSLGEHKATVRVRRTSGKVLEYSWTFTVLAEEPTLSGLPEGFQFVRPLPDSTITLQDYRKERLVPRYYAPGFADLRGGVCAGILPGKIVESGEFLEEGGVARKYSFVALDGVPPGDDAVIEGGCEPFRVSIRDESGCVVASYVGPHHYKCWQIDLDPGEHEAVVQLRKASGEVIEYTWQFTITSD